MVEITLPPLGETVDEGTITTWHKEPGDLVAADEPLFEVETDKVVTDVPCPVEGELVEILVAPGTTVPIGATVAVVRTVDGSPSGGSGHAASPAAGPADAHEGVAASPATVIEEGGDDREGRLPTRTDPRVQSPLVRRLLKEHGVDSTQIHGTGHGGRITRDDVLASVESGPPEPAPAPSGQQQAQPVPPRADAVERIPFTNVRRITAEHMVRSQATSAHTLTIVEVDYEQVARLRAEVGTEFKAAEGFSLTYLPFVIRATVDALREFPRLNASVGDDELVVHEGVHMGIAVALGLEGLVVPVIRNVQSLRLRAIARAVRDLSDRARSRRLGADDLQGGTFTVTNPGGYGTFAGAPIINQPQVAIINVDGVAKRPVVVERPGEPDSLAIHHVGHLSMSWDHRAIDGLYAAAFLDLLRRQIESNTWSKEL